MRFLANENVPGPVVAALRERGHDVMWIKETMSGADDPVVLALAQTEGRVVVTNDTDFGELAFRFGLSASDISSVTALAKPESPREQTKAYERIRRRQSLGLWGSSEKDDDRTPRTDTGRGRETPGGRSAECWR